jgi:hypothetical protein
VPTPTGGETFFRIPVSNGTEAKQMKTKLVLALFVICIISGCHGYGHLYPVQGPLASMSPVPTYTFNITYPGSPKYDRNQAGQVSMVLQDGEAFSGPWQMAYDKSGNAGAAKPESDSIAAAWDAVYGQSFYVAHILGASRVAHTALTGTQGTVLQIEWWDQSSAGDGTTIVGTKGIGRDSKGNIYKLVW